MEKSVMIPRVVNVMDLVLWRFAARFLYGKSSTDRCEPKQLWLSNQNPGHSGRFKAALAFFTQRLQLFHNTAPYIMEQSKGSEEQTEKTKVESNQAAVKTSSQSRVPAFTIPTITEVL